MSLRVLVDTNVLLRSIQVGNPQQIVASESLVTLSSKGHELCVSPQNLYEMWVVCTRPMAVNGLGMSSAQASSELAKIQSFLTLLHDGPTVFHAWRDIVTTENVLGKQAHDARLVAIMTVHGMGHLLTFNAADFRRYRSIHSLNPDDVIATHGLLQSLSPAPSA
jgi:predicted nucleic acid-binding protein